MTCPTGACRNRLVDAAGHLPFGVDTIALGLTGHSRQRTSRDRAGRCCRRSASLAVIGKASGQSASLLHGLDEVVGDQQGQVELAQAAILALGGG
jgi:hypothetical protein